MQNILEQIELLRDRANITYAEAKEVLELCNYDTVAALVHLEQQNKLHVRSDMHVSKTVSKGFKDVCAAIFKAGSEYRFVIRQDETIKLNIPVLLLVVTAVLMPPLAIGAVLIAMFTGHKVRFEKPDGNDVNFNEAIDRVSAATSAVGDKVTAVLK